MRLLDDERGQSVQVGAAILLGFVVIAITIYQVQVVSSQNAEVEFNHDQEIRQDMTELRNSINNAGSDGQSDSVSVKLGGQYPPRTIFVNPPPIQGSLQSQKAGNISFGNAEVEGSYGGLGNATDIVHSNHSTNRLVYVPRYFELDNPGTTSIEHSLAFKSLEDNTTDPLTRQPVVREGGSLTLTVLKGNVSEQGTQSVSLDPEAVSGPTDSVTITNRDPGPIELNLPTETPSVWNETIGTTDSDGVSNTRVAAWNPDAEVATVALEKDRYELQMALVSVGDDVGGSNRYNVSEPSAGGSGGGTGGQSGPYEIQWQDGQTDTSSGESVTLSVQTYPSGFESADVDFYLKDDGTGAEIQSEDDRTDVDGQAQVTVGDFSSNGSVEVYAQSGGTSDMHEISVGITGPSLPEDAVAFEDQNDNGDWEDGEPTFTESELATLSRAGDIYVMKDAVAGSFDIEGGSVTVEESVTLSTQDGGVNIQSSTDQVQVRGTIDTTQADGSGLSLSSEGSMNLDDSEILSQGRVTLTSSGTFSGDAMVVESNPGYGEITIDSEDTISLEETYLSSGGETSLTSSGDMTLSNARLEANMDWAALSGDLSQGSSTLYVDAAAFIIGGDDGTFEVSPPGVDVVGNPDRGSTT